MTQYPWVSYSGSGEIVLATVLAAAAAGVAYAAMRLPLPAALPRPGRKARVCMLVIWPMSIVAFLVCVSVYVLHARHEHLGHTAPTDPITPVTVIGLGIIFFAIALMHSSRGSWVALRSAVIGALVAPWIFEVPFDLVIMTRTTPLSPDPAAYRVLFFAPLLAVGVTTVLRLTASPVVRVSRLTLWCFAAMLAVWVIWALVGFAYPSAPIPFALNVASKILAFAATLSMFVPERSQVTAQKPAPVPWTSVM